MEQDTRPEAARILPPPPPPPSQEKALEAGAVEPSQLARARARATCAQCVVAGAVFLLSAGAGFPIGYSAVALPQLRAPNSSLLTDNDMGSWIASIHSAATPVGAFASGVLTERVGRRAALQLTALPFVAGWALVALARSHAVLLAGRAVAGLAVGLSAAPAQVLISEVAEPRNRGALAGTPMVSYSLGILCVYALGAALPWRAVAWLGTALPLAALAALALVPESPTWLVRRGRLPQASKALRWLRGGSVAAPLVSLTPQPPSFCFFLYFATLSLVPESPTWLVRRGRLPQASKALRWLRGGSVAAPLVSLTPQPPSFCFFLYFATLSLVPESPTWLVRRGRLPQASKALRWLRGGSVAAPLVSLTSQPPSFCFFLYFATLSLVPESPTWLVRRGRLPQASRALRWLRGGSVAAPLVSLTPQPPSFCFFLYFATLSLVPESPTWLVRRGRLPQASKALRWLRGGSVAAPLVSLTPQPPSFCFFLYFATLSLVPESPTWLVRRGRLPQASKALRWLRGGSVAAPLVSLTPQPPSFCFFLYFATLSLVPESPTWLVRRGRLPQASRALRWLRGGSVAAPLVSLTSQPPSFCFFLYFATLSLVPESPTWLVRRGRLPQASRALRWLRGGSVAAPLVSLTPQPPSFCFFLYFATLSLVPESPTWLVRRGRLPQASRALRWLRGGSVAAPLVSLTSQPPSFCFFLYFATLSLVPESPTWLVRRGRLPQASRALRWLRGGSVAAPLVSLTPQPPSFCFFLYFATLSLVPESPTWLVRRGRLPQASRALRWLRGGSVAAPLVSLTSQPPSFCFFLYFATLSLVPESPTWLVRRGRLPQASRALRWLRGGSVAAPLVSLTPQPPSFCFFLYFATLSLVPESPTWLVRRGRLPQASRALRWLRGGSVAAPLAQREFEQLVARLRSEETRGEAEAEAEAAPRPPEGCLRAFSRPDVYKPFFIVVTLNIMQIFSGTYLVIFYAVDLLEKANAGMDEALAAVLTAAVRVVFTAVACGLLSWTGRRALALSSGLTSGLAAVAMGSALYVRDGDAQGQGSDPYAAIVVGCLLVYMAANTCGFFVLPLITIGELLPAKVRGLAGGYIFASFNLALFAATKVFPSVTSEIGAHGVFWVFGIASLTGTVFIYLALPETKGQSLAQIEDYFRGKNFLWVTRHKYRSPEAPKV
ncbi:hypothetical protein R5R35_010204 [Gryllus longicercus]|uniref:Major facilitator superfamily (MFS) profile domain-containing protein n=1 Tax=Gryllus longicercus TaxID=2509291 RepID=A0AAN9ZE00_9ORTH